MDESIKTYNNRQIGNNKAICEALAQEIHVALPKAQNKVWHGAPVWFLDGNPVAGYAVRKHDVQLLFWSGQSFNEPGLEVEGTFKAAQVRYTDSDQINKDDLKRWLQKAEAIQWDYKNIVKRQGVLEKLTSF